MAVSVSTPEDAKVDDLVLRWMQSWTKMDSIRLVGVLLI